MIAWHGFGHDHFFFGGVGVIEILLGLLMMLLWAGFWIFVIVLIIRLVRRGAEHARTPTALHVLEERYARGEITREEFAERRSVLLGREPPPAP
ncbi:MAG TPA: SHOCT domain-containing protein [Actinomycetota bacterium]|nr:SHOCT domain-containing protein [Actinomycetota bacterium]